MTREQVMQALLAHVTPPGIFKTTGRRLIYWTEVKAQPALFVRHVGDRYLRTATGMPPRVITQAEIWIYSQGAVDPNLSPDTAIDNLVDAIERWMAPPPIKEAQTLGGLVQHAWIEGPIEIHQGVLDVQAIAVIPVDILVPVYAKS